MKKLNGGKEVAERLLFHGTSTSHLHHICAQNLDWRICGTHGTLYGKGMGMYVHARGVHVVMHSLCCRGDLTALRHSCSLQKAHHFGLSKNSSILSVPNLVPN